MIKFIEWFMLTTALNIMASFFIPELATGNFIGSCAAIIILTAYWSWMDRHSSEQQTRKQEHTQI